jgi:hypothetical protein
VIADFVGKLHEPLCEINDNKEHTAVGFPANATATLIFPSDASPFCFKGIQVQVESFANVTNTFEMTDPLVYLVSAFWYSLSIPSLDIQAE